MHAHASLYAHGSMGMVPPNYRENLHRFLCATILLFVYLSRPFRKAE